MTDPSAIRVCPRFGDHVQQPGKKLTFDHSFQIRIVRTLWADLDHCTSREALGRCTAAGLPHPTAVVHSGHGVHLYWVLEAPYLIDDAPIPPAPIHVAFRGRGVKPIRYVEIDGRRETNTALWPKVSPKGRGVERILEGIAGAVGGDHTQDLARLLRLPGTLNRKDQRNGKVPIPCVLVECDPERRYGLDEFERFAPPIAEAVPAVGRATPVSPHPTPIARRVIPGSGGGRVDGLIAAYASMPIGGRSEADWALVCTAIEEGLSPEDVWPRVATIGKFLERGRPYFDRTWHKAEIHVRSRLAEHDGDRSGCEQGSTANPAETGEAEARLDERADLWVSALGRGGLALDSAASAAGTIPRLCHEAIVRADLERTLIVCQSREECEDVVLEFLAASAAGVAWGRCRHAVVFPSRTPHNPERGTGNCRKYNEIVEALDLGLPPMGAVCLVCEFRDGCQYLAELERAQRARHGIMTAKRASLTDLAGAAEGKDAVFVVNGRALDVLVPGLELMLTPDEARKSLRWIAEAAGRSEANVCSRGTLENPYLDNIRRVAEALRAAVEEGTGRRIDLPPAAGPPRGWAASLKGIFEARGWRPHGDLVRVCTAAAAGDLRDLVARPDGQKIWFQATWAPQGVKSPTLVLDATLTIARLEAAMGLPVHEVGAAPPPAAAVQVPERVTAQKRPGATAKVLRGYLALHPGGPLGVVSPAEGHEGIAEHLTAGERDRLRMVGWGDDLRSLAGCVLTVVLGHPPVPPRAVASRLIRTGQADVAAEDGDWGDLPWEAELPWGRVEEIARRGYRHPAWQRAYQDLVLGGLRQVLANLSGPVVVHCAEDLGLPSTEPPPHLDEVDVRLLDALRELTLRNATKKEAPDNTLIVAKVGDSPKGLNSQGLCRKLGIPPSSARRRMNRMEAAGLAIRMGERGGWLPATPDGGGDA